MLNKLTAAAQKSGKLSSKVALFRFILNAEREEETTLTDDQMSAVIKAMPGNVADSDYQASVVEALQALENPKTGTVDEKLTKGASAQLDTTPQYVMAIKCGAAWDAEITDELEEDIQAGEQYKEAGLHTLDGLDRLFGANAPTNEFRNIISRWPLVDSEPGTAEAPFKPRFEGDFPAKYKVFNVTSRKHEPRDTYNIMFDATPLGSKLNKEIAELEDAINDRVGAVPQADWPTRKGYDGTVWGKVKDDLKGRKALLTGRKNTGRSKLKEAVTIYQTLATVNDLQGVVAKIRKDADGKISRPNPILIYNPENPAEETQRCKVSEFLSYDPAKAAEKGGTFAAFVATKPQRKPKSGTGKDATKIEASIPLDVHVFEAQMAMHGHFMDKAENVTAIWKEAVRNKALRMTICAEHIATQQFYNKWRAEYETFIQEGGDLTKPTEAKVA